ncbi:hypothetical protein E2C01_042508 [Portunus trituberculatus]|uniref:Uncharacterized protein n=1 Tax=Portunus trituberculatus TaxID=210409 RepID=A0A5B7FT90_PORTR|nr:hypothetical protein [Portunus trituberculatus]
MARLDETHRLSEASGPSDRRRDRLGTRRYGTDGTGRDRRWDGRGSDGVEMEAVSHPTSEQEYTETTPDSPLSPARARRLPRLAVFAYEP